MKLLSCINLLYQADYLEMEQNNPTVSPLNEEKEQLVNLKAAPESNLPIVETMKKIKEPQKSKAYSRRKKISPNTEKKNASEEPLKSETTVIKRKTKEKRKLRAFTRRLWGDDEDKAITVLVEKYGTKKWTLISRQLQEEYKIYGRSGKQCRERYIFLIK
eukprot:TRINITY_DN3396_c0_g2_i7.p2 TRINITY_DN3396_c0_g2~~TRINITY_DN3396_c0_g2_i7.p2  ORF type:complete len:160 (-),score=32.55 TRINITY_DN3396_c0_g2_i7:257-736(-)